MKVFESNCTLPPEGVRFVSAPNARGTLDIVWSCLSILLICTWSVLHLNVPEQTDPKTSRQKYWKKTTRLFWKLAWMLLNVAAPEWPLGKAWADYRSVSSAEARFRSIAEEDGVSWTRKHIYFANLGGFALKFRHLTPRTAPVVRLSSRHAASHETPGTEAITITSIPHLEHSHSLPTLAPADHSSRLQRSSTAPAYNTHGDVELDHVGSRNTITVANAGTGANGERALLYSVLHYIQIHLRHPWFPSAKQLQRAVKRKSQSFGPIDWALDESNASAVSHAIDIVGFHHFKSPWELHRFQTLPQVWIYNVAMLQGDLWILDATQLLYARELGIISHLPCVSEDDIDDRNKGDLFVKLAALGQIVWFLIELCARLRFRIATTQLEILTLAYAVCTAATYMLLLDKPKDAACSMAIEAARHPTAEELIRLANVGPALFGWIRTSLWIPNNSVHAELSADATPGLGAHYALSRGSTVALLILGGLHCIAWKFTFPSFAEEVLWQASSLVTALTLLTAVVLDIAVRRWGAGYSYFAMQGFLSYVWSWGAALFFTARIIILVEVFRSLAFQLPNAFATTWSNNIPHIG